MSTGVQTAIGRFVWHDLSTTDVDRAKDFYARLFGWETEVWKPGEMDYPMIKANGQQHGGFSAAQGEMPPHWIGHVVVDDVDKVVAKAQKAGGTILAGPMDMEEVGRFAGIRDPQGAVVSAFQPAGDAPVAEGVFVWDELLTTDVAEAKRFYGEVFGWGARDMDMGESGSYTIFTSGDADRAGCMLIRPGMEAPPSWNVYVGTQDVDAATETAKELGGTVIVEPMDIPGDIGRFAIVLDPTGAAFGLYKSAS
jgi:predicted enzyme related to lactoylglutathione lyase